ncbi:MAG: glycosyl hydrolase-related protein [Dictyoglomaceae bacterium]|nr:glycosyl hydrolase-related protein [Dictyoglomaceae bacterium]
MKVHIITHTHWDREWYAPFELFRQRLVELMDFLLKNIEKYEKFKHFMLDGQTIILEDYLELYPENKEKLVNLIKTGKIIVGPWYILPDEFLVMGESLIRNYIYGQKIIKNLGILGMNLGYFPDMFGHNAYTPTILKGLELKGGVVWRGVGDLSRKTEFLWVSPAGDEIITVNLLHSYSNGAHLGRNIDELKEKIKEEIKFLESNSVSGNILIMNGTDHEIPILELPEKFSEWSKELGIEIIHSNLENYVDEILKEKPKLDRVVGELRVPKHAPVLKDVTSSRIYLKILNFEAQVLYLKYLEPLSAISKILNISSRKGEIDYGWKNILRSQPHDSICGCSVDRVHKDGESRLNSTIEMGLGTLTRLLADIVLKLGREDKEKNIIVFNPLEKDGKRLVELYLNLDSPNYELYDSEGNKIESYIEPVGMLREEIYKFTGKNKYMLLTPLLEFLRGKRAGRAFLSPLFKLSFISNLPPLSFTSFVLKEKREKEESNNLEFESEYYFFRLNSHGTFDLYDKINKIELKNINYLEDQGDIGDEYNFSPTDEDPLRIIPEIKLIDVKNKGFLKVINLKGEITLPEGADGNKRSVNKISMPFCISYTLYRDFPRVDVSIEMENKSKDHRLRFGIDLEEEIDKVINDGYLGIVEHPTKLEKDKDYVEENVSRYAMESFVSLMGRKSKIMIVTRGLHEYETEVKEGKTSLKITLLRCIGYLSRGDLKTRKGFAGPYIPTPEAQCLGKYNFEYSFVLLNSNNIEELYEKARDYLIYPIGIGLPLKIKEEKFLEIPKGLFIPALKISEDEKDIILRLINTGEEKDYSIRSKFFKKAYIVNMKEENKEILEGNKEWKIRFKKGEVKTIRLILSLNQNY